MIAETQAKIDGAVVVGSMTSPWWWPLLENLLSNMATAVMWTGGFVLLVLRIAIAYREWRRR